MSTHVTRRCDFCGAQEKDATATRWGRVQLAAGQTYDVCLGCIAKLRGWENPIVSATGTRLREVV